MKTLLQILIMLSLLTQICSAQWMQVGLNDKSITDIAAQNSNIFAITSDSCLYRSIDSGANWNMIIDSNTVDVEMSLSWKVFIVRDTVGVGYVGKRTLYYSIDNGNTWMWSNIMEQIADSTPYHVPARISVSPTGIVFCHIDMPGYGIAYDRFAKSNDDGLTWDTPNILGGLLFDFRSQFVITVGEYWDLCGFNDAAQLSSDLGNTWTNLGGINMGGGPFGKIALGYFSNGNILLGGWTYWGGDKAILISTNNGTTWTQISSLNTQVGLSLSSGSSEGMIIGTDIGVFHFSDEGDSLGSRNEGLTDLNVQALTLDNNGYIYAGTGDGVWKRQLSELVTSIGETSIAFPSEFLLSQNYPNPFNPSTKIKYSVPQTSQVQIKVFDVLGNEIETLVNEEKPAGTYDITWTAANFPSGVYFYQLKAGEFVQTRKMLLIK